MRGAGVASRWTGPAAIAIAGVAMASWSWRQWPDVLVDFGRELYVAWQLSQGRVLYADLAYFNGPLSPYVNSLWFRLFGVSLMTLALSNLALLVVLVCLLYSILSRIASHLSATFACVTFLLLFAFGQYVRICNYNFVCPYSHEMTHGVVLSLAAVASVSRYERHRQLPSIACAGIAVGLLFLTKVEMFCAGALASVAGLVLAIGFERPARRRLLSILGSFAGGAVLAPLVAFLFFCRLMPLDEVLREPLGHFTSAFRQDLVSLKFFREGMGIDDVGGNLWALFRWAGWYAAILVPAAALALAVRTQGRRRPIFAAAIFAAVAGAIGWRWREVQWLEMARPLPLFTVLIGIGVVAALLKRSQDREARSKLILQLCMVTLALGLLLKMILNTRIYHYGFALAMPAAMLLVVALLDWLPARLDRAGGSGAIFRAGALAAWLVVVFAHLALIRNSFAPKTIRVGSGADAFWADSRGEVFNGALEDLRARAAPGRTLAAFPEGAMLNYLSRRANPTPFTFLNPFDVLYFGEARMLATFEAHPPDFVALVHRDTSPYGPKSFGRDYARKIQAWIDGNYRPVRLIGAPPFRTIRFGILLLERNEPS